MLRGGHYTFRDAYQNAVTEPRYEQLEDGEIVRLIKLDAPMSVVEHIEDGSFFEYPTVLMTTLDIKDIDPDIIKPIWTHYGCIRNRIR
jgi:hypothetical protein